MPHANPHSTDTRTRINKAAIVLLVSGLTFAQPVVAQPRLTLSPALSCSRWNTYNFFYFATAADVTRCLDAGADVGARNKSGDTPLYWAAMVRDSPAVVKVLLDAGADVEARSKNGFTPLHTAVV